MISELPIWLSLIKYSSLKLNRWLVPPPNLTAYFWITLRFGIVFLVQQILQFFPANLTNALVLVAIPEIWLIKFKATLSPIKMFWAFPSIVATKSFFLTEDPSFFFRLNFIFLSINLNVCFANSNPPIIALWFEINFIFVFLLFLTKLEVISPEG